MIPNRHLLRAAESLAASGYSIDDPIHESGQHRTWRTAYTDIADAIALGPRCADWITSPLNRNGETLGLRYINSRQSVSELVVTRPRVQVETFQNQAGNLEVVWFPKDWPDSRGDFLRFLDSQGRGGGHFNTLIYVRGYRDLAGLLHVEPQASSMRRAGEHLLRALYWFKEDLFEFLRKHTELTTIRDLKLIESESKLKEAVIE